VYLPQRGAVDWRNRKIQAAAVSHVPPDPWPVKSQENFKDLLKRVTTHKDRAASHSMASVHIPNEQALRNVTLVLVISLDVWANFGLAEFGQLARQSPEELSLLEDGIGIIISIVRGYLGSRGCLEIKR